MSSRYSSPAPPGPAFEPQDSRLLNLPAEIRNRIYHFAVASTESTHMRGGSLARPGLLQTCKQTAEEATQIYFASNKFVAHLTALTLARFIYALRVAGKQNAALISDLVIELDTEKEMVIFTEEVIQQTIHMEGPVRLYYKMGDPGVLAQWSSLAEFLVARGVRLSSVRIWADFDDDNVHDDPDEGFPPEYNSEAEDTYAYEWLSKLYSHGFKPAEKEGNASKLWAEEQLIYDRQ